MYPPSSVPTYRARANHMDIFMDEVNRELARKIVNQNFPLRPTWYQNRYDYTTNSSISTSHTQPSPIASEDNIIGY